MCGKNDQGQLGQGHCDTEHTPTYVSRIADKITEVACGVSITLALTLAGEVYSTGG